MERILNITPEFEEFYGSLNARTIKKVDNEYRVILFASDNLNFINANRIVVLNGFLKKSTADYDKQIAKAIKIMEDYI